MHHARRFLYLMRIGGCGPRGDRVPSPPGKGTVFMKIRTRRTRRGFSLVELLAVVLVIAVLAAVAIPLYTSQRKSAAGRACKANIAALSASLTGYALRNNTYPPSLNTLVGSAEGLAEIPKCPLGGDYA